VSPAGTPNYFWFAGYSALSRQYVQDHFMAWTQLTGSDFGERGSCGLEQAPTVSLLAQLILSGAGLARSPFRIRVRLLALEILVAAVPAPFLFA
jgi:hypothetical protein